MPLFPRSRVHRSGATSTVSQREMKQVMAHVTANVHIARDEPSLAEQTLKLKAAGAKTVFEMELEEDSRGNDDTTADKENASTAAASLPTSPVRSMPVAPPIMTPVSGPWLEGLNWRGGTGALLELTFAIGDPKASNLGSDTAGNDVSFIEPSCVTALPDGEICVCDAKAQQLVILTPEGQPRAYLAGGEGKSALKMPRGIACDDTSLYISEVGSSRVRKMRLPADFLRNQESTQRGGNLGGLNLEPVDAIENQLTFPQGLCLADGKLFVADCEDHRVAVYNATTLRYERHFGQYGEEEGALSFPYSIVAVGKELLVTDVANHRLSSFSVKTGRFVRTIGGEGDAPGQMRSPRSVAVLNQPPVMHKMPSGEAEGGSGGTAIESSGVMIDGQRVRLDKGAMLVVCEQKRVQVLTLAGEPMQIVSISDNPNTDLWSICAADKFMYVTDRGAGCVHVLAPPRMGKGADAAKSRYMTLTPRKGARAAAAANLAQMLQKAEEDDFHEVRPFEHSPLPM